MEEDNKITKIDFDPLSKSVVDVAFQIHQKIGSGLLESIYEDCFSYELQKRGIPFERQKFIPVVYDGTVMAAPLKLDLIVDGKIVVELKSVEKIMNAHSAQILSYMRMADIRTGLLVNFGDPYFKTAIKRFVL